MSVCQCGNDPCINPSFCSTCRRLDAAERKKPKRADPHLARLRELSASDLSLDAMWRELNTLNGRAAASTVEALAYQIRGGVGALQQSSAQRRLAQLDKAQLREICERLTKERWGLSKHGEMPLRVPPWTATKIEALVEIWKRAHK